MDLPQPGISPEGIPCVPVTLSRDSETQDVLVVYTSKTGIYWDMPLADFEKEPLAPAAPEPVFTVPLAKFQHFKGTTYKVVCRVRDPRTLENRLVYENPEGARWVRSEAMFMEEVEWPDGVRRARFVFVEG